MMSEFELSVAARDYISRVGAVNFRQLHSVYGGKASRLWSALMLCVDRREIVYSVRLGGYVSYWRANTFGTGTLRILNSYS